MKIVYVEFPETYREINSIIEKTTRLDYFSVPDTIDKYVELVVRMEVFRRWHNVDATLLRKWLHSMMVNYPITDDYFENNVVQKYIVHSSEIWGRVRSELTFTPSAEFMMWNTGDRLWKLITAGVSSHVE